MPLSLTWMCFHQVKVQVQKSNLFIHNSLGHTQDTSFKTIFKIAFHFVTFKNEMFGFIFKDWNLFCKET